MEEKKEGIDGKNQEISKGIQQAVLLMQETKVKPTRINKLVMSGFKSFAKHTEIFLGERFNCVLGPNGAGKSNVIDAVCFVLGKSSSRDLRAEKSANLIYNGGKLKQPAKKGEVSIFFDNTEKAFPIDAKEAKITRAVKQTGQSVYKINDEITTRQQVVDLLSLAKINPDSYNIILQGDIVRLVEMHPDERRMLLEDIAGISIYEEKKHKAMLELQKVDERLKETDIVLAERNSYLKELKKDRDEALKYKEMSDKIKQNKASYLKIQIDKKDLEKKELDSKLEKHNKELDELRKSIESIKQENIESRKKVESIEKEIEEKGEIEQVKLNREIESLKVDLAKKTSRLDTCKNELSKIKQRKNDLGLNIEETNRKIRQLEEEKKNCEGIVKSKEKEKAHMQKRLEELRGKNRIDNVAEIEKQVEEIDKKAEELQKEIQSLRESQHNRIRDKDRMQSEIRTVDDRINKIIDVEKEYQKQTASLESMRTEFKKSTLELNRCLDEDASLAARISNLRRNLNAMSEELAKLNARNIGIKEITRSDVAVTRILELKKEQHGIYGTISDLGNVSTKFALALEVAAGPRLKSIIVESDKVAAQCIKYLKEKRYGTATFLPLNKVKGRDASPDIKKLADSKGSYGIALDLIEFEPKFKKVFSYIFGETIVVDNIDVAVRLGIGNAKFVTLDGDLAESSGVMQGGFRIRKKDAAGFKEKELTKDIEGYETKISELRADVDVYEKRRASNEARITELRSLKASLDAEIIKGEKLLSMETTDINSLNSIKKEIAGQEKKLDKELDSIINSISDLNRGLANLKIEKQKLRVKINEMNNPALVAEIYTYEQKQREINEDAIKLSSNASSCERQIKEIFQPEIDKIGQIIKQLDKDEDDFEAELNILKDSIKSKEVALKEKETTAKDFYSRFKELFAESSKIKEKMQKNEFAVDGKNNESRQIEIKANTLSLKLAEIKAELTGIAAEFQQYEGVRLDLAKSEQELRNEISKFERMKEDIGSVNMRALEIYDDVERQYNELVEKKDTLSREKEDVAKMMNEIESRKKELFMETYNAVDNNFKRFFAMLTTKGAQAGFVLDNGENPFEGGVRINVKISGSKFLDIRSLSGGEKTMTALAFIFAIQEHEPASFYVLDEIDAALDEANSLRLAKLIKNYSEKAQYLMISHNDSVISEADTLYGISMNEDGISKVVGLKI